MNKLYGIQYLRAVAALGVVVFHAAERTGGHFVIGAAGVDVFFVVSGFIMWLLAETRQPSPGAFLRERIERIVPLYWIATAVMVAGGLAGLFPKMKLTAFHVFGSFGFIPHVSPSDGGTWPVLVQGWTLNYEMFFYALFAAVLFLPTAKRFVALGLVFGVLICLGMVLRPDGAVPRTYTSPLMAEFLIGAAIGKLWLAHRMPQALLGIPLILASIAGFALVGLGYLPFGPITLGPLSGMLLVGVLALERAGRIRHVRALTYLGDASYSIYLWHTIAISVVIKASGMLGLPTLPAFVLSMIAGTAAGLACHELLEKPIAAWFKARRHRASVRYAA
ncbi:acyltransferase [Mesorhizobium loti]|nr:acyltransferase [Mesorhizobium loti]PLP60171.1 acyltransferase [Mesorhizobium loti]